MYHVALAFAIIGAAVAFACLVVAAFAFLDNLQARRERDEDAEFAAAIAHLPAERQAQLWLAHWRGRAERDLL